MPRRGASDLAKRRGGSFDLTQPSKGRIVARYRANKGSQDHKLAAHPCACGPPSADRARGRAGRLLTERHLHLSATTGTKEVGSCHGLGVRPARRWEAVTGSNYRAVSAAPESAAAPVRPGVADSVRAARPSRRPLLAAAL